VVIFQQAQEKAVHGKAGFIHEDEKFSLKVILCRINRPLIPGQIENIVLAKKRQRRVYQVFEQLHRWFRGSPVVSPQVNYESFGAPPGQFGEKIIKEPSISAEIGAAETRDGEEGVIGGEMAGAGGIGGFKYHPLGGLRQGGIVNSPTVLP
jgi:hypothetical protein